MNHFVGSISPPKVLSSRPSALTDPVRNPNGFRIMPRESILPTECPCLSRISREFTESGVGRSSPILSPRKSVKPPFSMKVDIRLHLLPNTRANLNNTESICQFDMRGFFCVANPQNLFIRRTPLWDSSAIRQKLFFLLP